MTARLQTASLLCYKEPRRAPSAPKNWRRAFFRPRLSQEPRTRVDSVHTTDLDLVRRAIRQDSSAITELADRLLVVPRVLHAVNQRAGQRLTEHDIEDVSQDTLSLIWQKLDQFNGHSRIETWSYSFCINTFANAARKIDRQRRHLTTEEAVEEPVDVTSVPSLLFEHIHAAIDELGPPKSDVIRQRALDGLSFAEIAKGLAVPLSTAKTWFHRGLKELAHRLSEEGNP